MVPSDAPDPPFKAMSLLAFPTDEFLEGRRAYPILSAPEPIRPQASCPYPSSNGDGRAAEELRYVFDRHVALQIASRFVHPGSNTFNWQRHRGSIWYAFDHAPKSIRQCHGPRTISNPRFSEGGESIYETRNRDIAERDDTEPGGFVARLLTWFKRA